MGLYDKQQASIDRQKAIAQALRDTGNFSNSRVNQTAGGYVVPISPFEAASKLFNTGAGAFTQYKEGQAEDELATQKSKDRQAAISGLMDNLAGPSQMGVPQNPSAPPVGATTNFDPTALGAGTSQPQQPSMSNAAPSEQNQKRAAMAALLQGQPSDQIIQSLQGAALKKYEPKPDYSLKSDEERISGDTNQPVATGLPKEYKPAAEDRALINIVNAKDPKGYSSIERQHFKEGVDQLYQKPNAGDTAAAGFTGSALDRAAAQFNIDGTLPTGTGRSPAMVVKIMNRASEMSDEIGDSSKAAATRAMAGKATAAALKKFEGSAQAIAGFEKLATKSADLAEQKADLVGRTGTKIFNEWINAGRTKVTGNTELGVFYDANETFVSEYAKIMSGSMGNTAVSDAAAKYAHNLLDTADTPEAYHQKMATLRQEMANRMKAQSGERVELYNQLAGSGPDAIPGSAAATASSGSVPPEIQALLDKHAPVSK